MRIAGLSFSGLALLAAASPDGLGWLLMQAKDHPELARLVNAHPAMSDDYADPDVRRVMENTANIPGTSWRIHDIRRPQPRLAKPGECRVGPPPKDAVMLFDGNDLDMWVGQKIADWTIKDGILTAGGRRANMITSRILLGDSELHLEWRTPVPPGGNGQTRGNSGIYIGGLYEIQILDSFRNPTYPDGQAGAIYGQVPPRLNVSRPPGQWQCFDIKWKAPRFEDDRLISPARITLRHNGVLIHDDVAVLGPTAWAKIEPYVPHPTAMPLRLQDHGDAGGRVSFRNIWARPMETSQ